MSQRTSTNRRLYTNEEDLSKVNFEPGISVDINFVTTVGIKLLSSKDAKKAYVHATAAGLRMKDYVMETVTTVQENASDILASAKDLNEERAAKEAEEAAAAQLETSEEE